MVDNAYYFDGVDDYIDMGNVNDMTTGDFSIVAWINRDEGGITNARILSKGAGNDATAGYALFSSESSVSFIVGNGTARQSINTTFNHSEWTQLVGVRSGGNISLYINGEFVLQGTGMSESLSSSASFFVGDNDGQSTPFPGLIDEVRVYNQALSADGIAALYKENSWGTPILHSAQPNAAVPGNQIRLYGKHFDEPNTVVSFDGTDVTPDSVLHNVAYVTVPNIGHGPADVTVSNDYGSSMSLAFTVIRENSGGYFSTEKVISTSADRVAWVFGIDLDKDGDMDVLSASRNDDKIAWYENDGKQNYTEHAISTSADGAKGVHAVDLDLDGDIDVLSASEDDHKIAWYENDGNQNFTEYVIDNSANTVTRVHSADVNGDGHLDVLANHPGSDDIVWYQNNGNENFTAHYVSNTVDVPKTLRATDIDDDGDMDLYISSIGDDKIAWYENDGNESFTEHIISTNADYAMMARVIDLDQDGDQDFVSASWTDTKVAWYENDGDENFTEILITDTTSYPRSIDITDLEGDGDYDIVTTSRTHDLYITLTNGGNQTFAGEVIGTNADYAFSVHAVDLDGDGDMDIIGGSGLDDKIVWYENQSFDESGLVAFYPFNGDANDSTEYANHGAETGGIALATDRFGASNSAYDFNGTDAYLDMGNVNDFTTENFTISAWINRDEGGISNSRIVAKGAGNDDLAGYALYGSDTQVYFAISKGDGSTRPFATGDINHSVWNHLVGVKDGNGLKLYVNGVLADSVEGLTESITNSSKLLIGENDGQSTLFPGLIDDIRIYDRALNADEVVLLYDLEQPTLSDGLVAYYQLDGDATDSTENGYDGTELGGLTYSSDRFGNANGAVLLDGDDDRIEVLGIDTSAYFTTSVWYQTSPDLAIDYAVMLDIEGYLGMVVVDQNHTRVLINNDGTNYTVIDDDKNVADESWHHAVATYDGTDLQLYVDGELAVSTPTEDTKGQNQFNLRLGATAGSVSWHGKLDDMRLYDRPMDASEVKKLYDQERPVFNLISSSPATFAKGVAGSSNIVFEFDKVVDPGFIHNSTLNDLSDDNILIIASQTGSVGGVFSKDGTSVTFDPSRDFLPGEHVFVYINDLLLDSTVVIEFDVQASQAAAVFETEQNIANGGSDFTQVVLADLDSDGDLDAIKGSMNNGILGWYENTDGAGTFASEQTIQDFASSTLASPVLVDFDLDGDMDIITLSFGASGITWYENDGSENFTVNDLFIGEHTTDGLAVDLDGDGDMDFISSYGNVLSVFENDGGMNFSLRQYETGTIGVRGIAVGDLDKDGDLDISVASVYTGIYWFRNDGDFDLTMTSISTTISEPSDTEMTDLDEDGDLDIVIAASNGAALRWLEHDGSLGFTERSISANVSGAGSLKVNDINGDGFQDIILVSNFSSKMSVFFNDGSENFSELILTEGSRPSANDAGDIDGDGDLDIAIAFQSSSKIVWHKQLSAVDEGLIAYYKLDNDALDATTNGNDGTVNGATVTNDRFGNTSAAYEFVESESIDLPVDIDPYLDNMTISAWVYFDTVDQSTDSYIISQWDSPNGFGIYTDAGGGGNLRFFGDQPTTGDPSYSSDLLSAGLWYHIVGVSDGTSKAMYLNGVLVDTNDNAWNDSGLSGLTVGDAFASPVSIDGRVDDIRIYNRALDSAEVAQLYFQDDWLANDPTSFVTTWQTTTANESITIPTTGTGYDYTVDWGDGTIETGQNGDATHSYATAGTYTVAIKGDFPRIYFNNGVEGQDTAKIVSVDQWGDIAWTSMQNSFYGCFNLDITATDAPDLSNVTSLTSMFQGATSVNADLDHWNVSRIVNFDNMFSNAFTFNGAVSSWDLSNALVLFGMFAEANSFNQNIDSWDLSNVVSIGLMFSGADVYNQPMDSWDVSNVTDMRSMFYWAQQFDQSLAAWDISSVEQNNSEDGIRSIFFNTSMSKTNYDATLQGWATLEAGETQIPSGIELGASGLEYCSVTARNTLINEHNWTISGDVASCSSASDITGFDITDQIGDEVINTSDHTVAVTMPNGTVLTSLTPTITQSTGATIDPLTGVAQDFSSPVTYTVTAENDSTQDWTVTITNADNDSTDILSLSHPELVSGSLSIDTSAHTVIATVPYGTSLSALDPTITVSGDASINPTSGTSLDFTTAQTYTVTAQNGDEQDWTITITNQDNDSTDILTFSHSALVAGSLSIDTSAHTVTATVPYGTSLTALDPTITVSGDATINPTSGTSLDFTSAQTYTVTAQNGDTQDWTVTIQEGTGLMAFYKLDANATDSTGNGHNGTLSTGFQFTEDRFGNANSAAYFDGDDDYIALSSPLLGIGSKTISFWFKPYEEDQLQYLVKNDETVRGVDIYSQYGSVAGSIRAGVGNSSHISTGTAPPVSVDYHDWNHAVMVFDASAETLKWYKNGSLLATSTGVSNTEVIGTHNLRFGASPDAANNNFFFGEMDDIAIYGVALEDSDIADLFGYGNWPSSSQANSIHEFSITGQVGNTTIDFGVDVIDVTMPYNTSLTSLKPSVVLSPGATISPDTSLARDFSSELTYTVTSGNGTDNEWTIRVATEESDSTDILTFSHSALVAGSLSIDTSAHTVIATVPYGTSLSALDPTITVSSDASINPISGTSLDFTTAQTYTVTAQNGDTQDWTVTIANAENDSTDILSFSHPELVSGSVDTSAHTVTATLPYGTSLMALAPTITVSGDATINPTSGTSLDFTSAQTYTVTAQNGDTQDWTVTISNVANDSTDILSFSHPELVSGSLSIDASAHTISATMADGTDLTVLAPTILVSTGSTISPASGTAQDFSTAVTYTVTAENGDTQAWSVMVTTAESFSDSTDITSFVIASGDGHPEPVEGTIDTSTHTVSLTMPYDTDLTVLTPTIEVSTGATISPASGTAQDFSSAVTYTVTAENGDTQAWIISVNVQQNSASDILTYSIPDELQTATIDNGNQDITVYLDQETILTGLVPAFTISEGATLKLDGTAQISGTSAIDLTDSITYYVIAENGVDSAEWTVSAVLVDPDNNAPTGLTLSADSVYEEQNPGTLVAQLTTVDADASDSHTYQLVQGEGDTHNQFFDIEGDSLVTKLKLDFEEGINPYKIRLQTSDGRGGVLANSFEIRLIDLNETGNNKPFAILLSGNEIMENSGVNQYIGTFSTMDPDDVDSHTYELINGADDFRIVGDSLRSNVDFDFEQKTSYQITVKSTDSGLASISENFTVFITDEVETPSNNPPTGIILSNRTIPANSGPGFEVGELSLIDEDANDQQTFEVNIGELFEVKGNILVTTEDLTAGSHNLTISGSDGHTTLIEAITITVENPSDMVNDLAEIVNEQGKKQEHYRIIAVPLRSIGLSAFFEKLGADKLGKTWRILQYSTATNAVDLTSSASLKAGEGYWFAADADVDFEIPMGSKWAQLNRDHRFEMNLESGWNMIGNPFMESLDWAAVIQWNIDQGFVAADDFVGDVGKVYVYNGAYQQVSRLERFEGGFLKVNRALTLYLPKHEINSAGRMGDGDASYFFSPNEWRLQMELTHGIRSSNLTGIGMSAASEVGLDRLDLETPPSLGNNYSFALTESLSGLSRSMVSPEEGFTWDYELNVSEPVAKLDWDQSALQNMPGHLMLYLPELEMGYDMKSMSSLSLKTADVQKIQFIYGSEVLLDKMLLPALVYPNPMKEMATFRFFVDGDGQEHVKVSIYSLSGKLVEQMESEIRTGRWSEVKWYAEGFEAGVYLYQIINGERKSEMKRLILTK
ncbi:MAG: VCBS repeat-containing protein [Cyclobacteriaceae bacterium]